MIHYSKPWIVGIIVETINSCQDAVLTECESLQPKSNSNRRTIAFSLVDNLQSVGFLLAELVKANHDERMIVIGTDHRCEDSVEENLAGVAVRKLSSFHTLVLWGTHLPERKSHEIHDLNNRINHAESMAHVLKRNSNELLHTAISKAESGKVIVLMPLAHDSISEVASLILRYSAGIFHTTDYFMRSSSVLKGPYREN